MDLKKQSGFSLFPQPPTPPTRRRRKGSSSTSSNKLTKPRPSDREHGRKLSLCGTSSVPTSPGLIPAPLNIRKSDEDIPPIPLTVPALPALPVSTPIKKKKKGHSLAPITPDRNLIQLDTNISRTPSRRHDAIGQTKLKPRAVSDFLELEASSRRRRASTRFSQWLDIEDGEIDRKRLSMYLGSVLDNTFEVPTFESVPLPLITPLDGTSRETSRPPTSMSRRPLSSLRPPTGRCDCPVGVVICHCSSSPDFERFKNWNHHKSSASISSTACRLGVPRARFQSPFCHIPEPPMVELPSPPGLCYESEEEHSEMGDWSSPKTPCGDDVFASSRSRSQSSKHLASASTSMSAGQSRFQSFSRPFRPESTTLCVSVQDSPPSTPSRKQGKSKGLKFLRSISTLSSFDFDFDFDPMGNALPRNEILSTAHQAPGNSMDELNQPTGHLRNESGESISSLITPAVYELSTATATVARTSSSVKPMLVNTPGKRKKSSTPKSSTSSNEGGSSHSHSHNRSKSRSVSTSLSESSNGLSLASSSLQSWRTANEHFSRSRSCTTTTNASVATTGSNGLTALLHMPLLPPHHRHIPKRSTSQNFPTMLPGTEQTSSTAPVVSGNAFARSKSSPMPNTISAGKEVMPMPNDIPHPIPPRSNTHAGITSNRAVSNPSTITTYSTPHESIPTLSQPTPRHRRNPPSRSGQRHSPDSQSISFSKSDRNSNYLYPDDRSNPRNDSGVFGLMSPPFHQHPDHLYLQDPTPSPTISTNPSILYHDRADHPFELPDSPVSRDAVFELENQHGYEYDCEPRFYRCLSNAARTR